MDIRRDDLSGPEIRGLLEVHLRSMHSLSPPESVHALDLTKLLRPEITFWTIWNGKELLGCGALKELEPGHGEIKSMRTVSRHQRTGAGRTMLNHIVKEARSRRYSRLSLETGSHAAFLPARKLYEGFGFNLCAPFNGYIEDPNSVFMSMEI
jgi:putative acetyltransferase